MKRGRTSVAATPPRSSQVPPALSRQELILRLQEAEATIRAIRSGEVLAGGSTLRLDSDHRFALAVTRFWNRVSRFRRLVAGSFIFVNAAAFREIGGFSKEFFASEEIDLSKKLKRLARDRGLEIRILHEHPLLTSARKMHLYTPGEHLRFLLRTALARGKNLKDRDGCPTWYDGRR